MDEDERRAEEMLNEWRSIYLEQEIENDLAEEREKNGKL